MASNGAQSWAPVLSALFTLQSNVDRPQKSQAHEYLEKFQKSTEAWSSTFAILQTPNAASEAKLFAATTLKGKITYDLHQVPHDSLPALRDTLLSLLSTYGGGPKPIRTTLCVCLANLAIQMTEWKDVLALILSTLGTDTKGIACIFEFLHVLPEEVIEGRKINLSEEDLSSRTAELLQENAEQVVSILIQYSQSSPAAAKDPQLLDCITSWLREVPLSEIINSPLLDSITNALSSDDSFDSAVECLSAIFRETRDVDESLNMIRTLYPRVLSLRSKIAHSAEAEDAEALRGVTRVFAEAGEAWVVLIARLPDDFRGLVESVLECATRDTGREAISLTFNFWYELKQYLVLENYMEARAKLADLYSKLVDVMIGHLEYPKPESGNEKDLFEGDREQEEKFREFRHQMGDVLKDCCEVIGVTECLQKSYDLIQAWVSSNASNSTNGSIPNWQALEAPLFSLRAMGRMVPPDESIMLPRLIPLIIQIPDHEKVRFQAIMALGRYTEWTSQHPAVLQPQLDFIMSAFSHPSNEVIRAAAVSFRFFCDDCAELLKDYVGQIQQFYHTVIGGLPATSQEEITWGMGAVLARQPLENVYASFKATCDPVVNALMQMSQSAHDDPTRLAVADKLELVVILVRCIQPHVEAGQPHPAVKYCQEIFPVLANIAGHFPKFIPILERVCRCWRYMVLSYRSAMAPLLDQLAHNLAGGFSASRQGCFLWTTDAIVREFSAGAENVDASTTDAIFQFYEKQATTFLQALSELTPEELPDVIEDFFRLTIDVILFFPYKTISSSLIRPILSASISSLTLLKEEPLMSSLHFLRDLLAYGGESSPSSTFDDAASEAQPSQNPPQIRTAIKQLVSQEGEVLTQRIMTGMMYSLPRDCFPDASGVMLALFQLSPLETTGWLRTTINLLPEGSIAPQESQRLLGSIEQRIQSGEPRKIRAILQDFTNSFRRRNVAPREGLGRLEATKFRFNR